MYQIGNCACTKTAHILKVSELIVFCLFVALHWKTILFIVANAIRLPDIRHVSGTEFFVFQQDSAQLTEPRKKLHC